MKIYVAMGHVDYEGDDVLGVGLKRKDANLIIRKNKRDFGKDNCNI